MKSYNVLVGFEESQIVCNEFRSKNIEAYSCDLQNTSGSNPQWHIRGDISNEIVKGGRLAILHPPCTCLSLSGNGTYGITKPKYDQRQKAIEYTYNIWQTACRYFDYVCLENPVGVLNKDKRFKKPQIITPYYFGDPHQKRTCLWLYQLPPLFHADKIDIFCKEITHCEPGEWQYWTDKNGNLKRQPMWYYKAYGKERSKIRSKTFPGIAKAMADQWSIFVK